MNLADLRDFVGNLLDYDPTNPTYDAQIVALLNDAQSRVLTDRPWDFCEREGVASVMTDTTIEVIVVNGSGSVAGGSFPVSSSVVTPGSPLDGGEVEITDSSGKKGTYRVAWVSGSSQLYLTTDFLGVSGTYDAVFKQREIYLPPDTATCMNVQWTAENSIPRNQVVLSKFERDVYNYNPAILGVPQAFIPSVGARVPAPRTPNGVSVVAASSQGARTINVYMVNVWGPLVPTPSVYPADASGGRESGLSQVASYDLADNETLEFTPETIPNVSGLYRRYYFTCPALGIKAPVRIRSAGGQGKAAANVDTVPPTGSTTLNPDLSTTNLTSQTFQTRSIRLVPSNGVYQSFLLYPHPSTDTDMKVRRLISPSPMMEDQDVPLVPESYAQIIAFAALEQISMKLSQLPLAESWRRKKEQLLKGMEQRFLSTPARRIQKGAAQTGLANVPPWYGPLRFIP